MSYLMRRRYKNLLRKKDIIKRRIIFISILFCLTFIFATAHSAFSTSINFNTKGNIKELTAAHYLKTKVTSSGDGLYKDNYQKGKYVYKGIEPDNYLKLNNVLYRIIAIESDGTLKIIKNETIGAFPFDTTNTRNEGYCSYGNAFLYGCNAWAKTDNYQNYYSGAVEKDAYINTYLNNDYLNTLDKTYLSLHTYNIGPVTFAGSILENTLQAEKQITWQSYIGLPNISDFLNSNTNPSCNTINKLQKNYQTCIKTNYLNFSNTTRLINPNSNFTHCVYVLFPAGNLYPGTNANNAYNICPIMFLKENITLSGKGSREIPYEPHIISNQQVILLLIKKI